MSFSAAGESLARESVVWAIEPLLFPYVGRLDPMLTCCAGYYRVCRIQFRILPDSPFES
jgi:hypothetical protein